tara:strand:+ start:596 stop:1555 length:960 start_codon:yes stop_codon:yes gene_type:complete
VRDGGKFGRQQNHIWSASELDRALATAHDKHQPTETSDHLMHSIMYYGLYHPFNLVTGYRENDPSPTSIAWRLIVLESFAGVPGFVAAGMRHFRSLRVLERDYGWIHTLLEEAENERMQLLVCLKMFNAGPVTRLMCVGAQVAMTPFLMATYIIKPKAMHRFVGYLEQTTCSTYHNIITHIETPGTQLHAEWSELDAPELAKGYWKLEDDAKWVDALRCIYADESHHRDVNHTFCVTSTTRWTRTTPTPSSSSTKRTPRARGDSRRRSVCCTSTGPPRWRESVRDRASRLHPRAPTSFLARSRDGGWQHTLTSLLHPHV